MAPYGSRFGRLVTLDQDVPWVAAVLAERARALEGQTMSETEHEITVFYDGACPRCVRDRERYETWAGRAGVPVCWFDITGQDERLRALGIDPRRALTELHVLDERRRIRSELDAYILLLNRIPWLKPLASLIGRPWSRLWLARLYHASRREHRTPKSWAGLAPRCPGRTDEPAFTDELAFFRIRGQTPIGDLGGTHAPFHSFHQRSRFISLLRVDRRLALPIQTLTDRCRPALARPAS